MGAKVLFFLLSLSGFALISLSMPRHYRGVRPASKALAPLTVKLIRSMGFLILFAACFWSVQSQGIALGLVYVFGQLTLVALLLALLLSYRPRWLGKCLLASFAGAGFIVVFQGSLV